MIDVKHMSTPGLNCNLFFNQRLSVAKVEKKAGNIRNQVEQILTASRNFLHSDQFTDAQLNCPNMNEHMRMAVDCFDRAVRIYNRHGYHHQAGSLLVEIADYLSEKELKSEALVKYEAAVELFQDFHPYLCVETLQKVADIQVESRNFVKSLESSTRALEMIEDKGGYHGDGKTLTESFYLFHQHFELMTVFLIMILNISPHKMGKKHSQVLKKYAWNDASSSKVSNEMNVELLITVKSFVMACSSHNNKSLLFLEEKLEGLLPHSLYSLVRIAVKRIVDPVYIT